MLFFMSGTCSLLSKSFRMGFWACWRTYGVGRKVGTTQATCLAHYFEVVIFFSEN